MSVECVPGRKSPRTASLFDVRGVVLLFASTLVLASVLLQPAASRGQTTAITPSGLGTTVTQNGTIFNIEGGTPVTGRSRTNLFHSFGQFSVGTIDTANFNNTTGLTIANVLGRVTGDRKSTRLNSSHIQKSRMPSSA